MNRAKLKAAPGSRGVLLVLAALAIVAGVVGFGSVASAQSGADGSAYEEAEAQAIDRMLMCPVCPAQTIDQTEVPLAKQMRAQVRELLSEGKTRKEVLAWFSAPERYGPGVLAEPPRSGFYLIAWIVPGVAVVIALAGGVLTLRAMRRRDDDTQLDTSREADELQPYLAAVDRDLALNPDTERNDG